MQQTPNLRLSQVLPYPLLDYSFALHSIPYEFFTIFQLPSYATTALRDLFFDISTTILALGNPSSIAPYRPTGCSPIHTATV